MTKTEMVITAVLVLVILLLFLWLLFRQAADEQKLHWNNHDWPCPGCGQKTSIMTLKDFGACTACMEMQDGTFGMG